MYTHTYTIMIYFTETFLHKYVCVQMYMRIYLDTCKYTCTHTYIHVCIQMCKVSLGVPCFVASSHCMQTHSNANTTRTITLEHTLSQSLSHTLTCTHSYCGKVTVGCTAWGVVAVVPTFDMHTHAHSFSYIRRHTHIRIHINMVTCSYFPTGIVISF